MRPLETRRMPALRIVVLAGLLVAAVGCGHAGRSTSPAGPLPANGPGSSAAATGPTGAGGGVSKVLVIVEENHSLAQMERGMPSLDALAHQYGYTTSFTAVAHPSLPNYLAMAGGSTFGVTDDGSPSAHPLTGASIFGQAVSAGRSARLYAESMPVPCDARPASPYAVKHAPWAYFTEERTLCQAGMLPAGIPAGGSLASDIARGSLPTIGMLIPNLDHDAHDGSLAGADGWLRGWMSPLLAGPDFTAGRLVVVVTADEDDGGGTNTVLTVVVAPGVAHRVVTTPLDHYSITRLCDDVIGAQPLRAAGSATSLATAFGVRVAAH